MFLKFFGGARRYINNNQKNNLKTKNTLKEIQKETSVEKALMDSWDEGEEQLEIVANSEATQTGSPAFQSEEKYFYDFEKIFEQLSKIYRLYFLI